MRILAKLRNADGYENMSRQHHLELHLLQNQNYIINPPPIQKFGFYFHPSKTTPELLPFQFT